MQEFFRSVLPEKGVYTITSPVINRTGKKSWKYRAFDTFGDFINYLSTVPQQEINSTDFYFSPTAFKAYKQKEDGWLEPGFKTQDNADRIRSLFLDLDCGEGKEYPNQGEAIKALRAFIAESGFPDPYVINSGNGVHVYWPFQESIPANEWQTLANKFKDMISAFGFKADPAVTSDVSRILRLPNSFNHKTHPPKKVEIVRSASKVLAVSEYETLIINGLDMKGVATDFFIYEMPDDSPFKNGEGNLQTYDQQSVSREAVYAGCAQMRYAGIEKKGDLSEPHWISMLQLERYLDNPQYHEISKGYDKYDPEKVEEKVERLISEDWKPTACSAFDTHNPNLCKSCPHYGKLRSPIVLGRPKKNQNEVVKVEEVVEQVHEVHVSEDDVVTKKEMSNRDGEIGDIYIHNDKGVFMRDPGDFGVESLVQISPFNFYGVRRIWDHNESVELMLVKVHPMHDDPREFTISGADIVDPRKLKSVLGRYGITAINGQDQMLYAYMISYLQKIQAEARAIKSYSQLGWQEEENCFVLPDRIYYEDGIVKDNGSTSMIASASSFIGQKGSLEEWKKIVNIYAKPGYECYAFGFLVGFASILFRFTDYNGALVNLMGDSGSGKTTVLKLINSIFGHPDMGLMTHRDTGNAKIKRISTLKSICPTYDEITNIEPNTLSDFCYSVSDGRDKFKLRSDSSEMSNNAHWNLILASSSNTNLSQVLGLAKMNNKAESLRVFEYRVGTEHHKLTKREAMEGFSPLKNNYGHAGEIFVKHVITRTEELEKQVTEEIYKFDEKSKAKIEERFWTAIAGTVLLAGKITKELGLHEFDMDRLESWAHVTFQEARINLRENHDDPEIILSNFINQHLGQLYTENEKDFLGEGEPRYKICMRYEKKAEAMYIDRSVLKNWINGNRGDFNSLKTALQASGILKHEKRRMTLSKGAKYIKSGQVYCWLIDMDHPLMKDAQPEISIVKQAVSLENDKFIHSKT